MVTQSRLLVAILALSVLSTACASGPTSTKSRSKDPVGAVAARHALSMVGTNYRYGGNHPAKGFDCSGLVQYSYKRAGVVVPRNTKLQRKSSRAVSHTRLKRGDLLFFNQAGKRSGHVAIYVGDNRFVHAPSSGKTVRVDSLKNRYWRRHLTSARRFATR